jgi:hydroxymethylbilane synthase
VRVRISGRSSDLSRIQVHAVADAIRAAAPDTEILLQFRESLGDRMQGDPLWAMPEKGVFTEDFVDDLRAGRTDLVVHSWKDLPTARTPGTGVVATLRRADPRDVLLVRSDRWRLVRPGDGISILSSSPRRAHNLTPLLAWALPARDLRIEFAPVRGNVPTRIRKLLEGDHDGLVVAKAALDRLLGSTASEFAATREELRRHLDLCRWMVLPANENPTGAGQGALAIEIAHDCDPGIASLIDSLNHETTFREATREREILASHGGGCHQKIGVTVRSRSYGTIVSLRGLTESGEILERFELETARKTPRTAPEKIWPSQPKQDEWMAREPIAIRRPDGDDAFWVARAEALPRDWEIEAIRIVWTAGSKSWRQLAERGVWINGCAEGLGESESPRADLLAGRPLRWVKLSHDRGEAETGMEKLATYRLIARSDPPDLSRYTHFFWTSGSRFLEAVERQPALLDRWHACGPGNTWKIVRDRLGGEDRLDIWLSHADWMKELLS